MAELFNPEDMDIDVNELMEGMEEMSVTLEMEDGTEVECAILTIYEVEGQDYIALLPLNENGEPEDDAEIYLYRYFENEGEEPSLENIEDDDEYERAADAFDELLDEQEFDFEIEEDEEVDF